MTKIKRIIIIAAAILLVVAVSFYWKSRRAIAPGENFNVNDQKEAIEPQTACQKNGGTWKEMPDPCSHTCDYQRQALRGEKMFCIQVVTAGCQCPDGQCWNGEACEKL